MKKKNKPSLTPQKVSDTDWYYEYRGGIEVIHQVWVNGVCIRTDYIKIPKKMLMATLKRIT